MVTKEQIEAAHEVWEQESGLWQIEVLHGYHQRWIVRRHYPISNVGQESILDNEVAMHLFDTKAEAMWFKREMLIKAMLEAVEKLKEPTDVKG